MSASSHTRGHRFAPEFTAIVLNWLEFHNRRIINNSRALSLELSKSLQYKELAKEKIQVPKTVYAKQPRKYYSQIVKIKVLLLLFLKPNAFFPILWGLLPPTRDTIFFHR